MPRAQDLSRSAFLRSAVNIGLLILAALIVADKLGIPSPR